MNTGTFSLYTPITALGIPIGLVLAGPANTLVVTDADDEWFQLPDQTGNNQTALIGGNPANITLIETSIVSINVSVSIAGGPPTNVSVLPMRVIINGQQYIILQGMPPNATILLAVTLPVFPNNAPLPLCFDGKALIQTAKGPQRAIDLRVGDLVETVDRGYRPIIWLGKKRVDFNANPEMQKHTPIVFERGSIDGTLPARRLRLSPQHRVLVTGWRAQFYFGADAILVPAKSLVNGTSVWQDTGCGSIDYVHILLDSHELILAEGAPAETLLLGDITMEVAGSDLRDELLDIFPDLEALAASMTAARMSVRAREGRVLVNA